MGQKVHPYGFRLGYIKDWQSKWFAPKKDYAQLLHEDIHLRDYLKKTLSGAAVSYITIERAATRMRIAIHTARPGIIIGRKGAEIDRLREDLHKMTGKEVYIDIKEIKNPSVEAQLIAENITLQLEKRIAHRRAMKKAMQLARQGGVEGIKVMVKGRIGGAEIARKEGYKDGKVPLQTIRADIDYGFAEALTTYGKIGVKVWVYKGDIIVKKKPLKKAIANVDAQAGQVS